MSGERSERRSIAFLVLAIAPPVLALVTYLGGYVWARGTHRLVHYAYGPIAAGDTGAMRGIAVSEIVFAPAIAVESHLRAWVDPSWAPPVVMPTSMMDGS